MKAYKVFWASENTPKSGVLGSAIMNFFYLTKPLDYRFTAIHALQGKDGFFCPPPGWGPFAAFEALDFALPFAKKIAKNHKGFFEVWEVEGPRSGADALAMPFSRCPFEDTPIGTVFLKSFKLVKQVARFSPKKV